MCTCTIVLFRHQLACFCEWGMKDRCVWVGGVKCTPIVHLSTLEVEWVFVSVVM